MHFTKVAYTALLVSLATATPIKQSKRQIGGLGSILNILKDILPVNDLPTGGSSGGGLGGGLGGGSLPGGSGNVPNLTTGGVPDLPTGDLPTGGLPTGSLPTGSSPNLPTGVPSPATGVNNDCTDAIAKIDDAITLSSALMQANSGPPDLRTILIVFASLERSLGKECKDNNTSLDTRDETCSDCERALYKIVQELQAIFILGANASGNLPTNSLPTDVPGSGLLSNSSLPTGTYSNSSSPTSDTPTLPNSNLPTRVANATLPTDGPVSDDLSDPLSIPSMTTSTVSMSSMSMDSMTTEDLPTSTLSTSSLPTDSMSMEDMTTSDTSSMPSATDVSATIRV